MFSGTDPVGASTLQLVCTMLCSCGDDDVIVASCLGDPVCLSFKYQ